MENNQTQDNSVQNESQQSAEQQTPQEVMELQGLLREVNMHVNTVRGCTFSGSQAQNVASLVEFLKKIYSQVLTQYEAHPYIVEAKKKYEAEAAQRETEQAEAQRLADEMSKEIEQ
jgi:pyruvate-formate lyase-activating enzyme